MENMTVHAEDVMGRFARERRRTVLDLYRAYWEQLVLVPDEGRKVGRNTNVEVERKALMLFLHLR